MEIQSILANRGIETLNRSKEKEYLIDMTLAKEDDEEILTDPDIKYIGKYFGNDILIEKYICNKEEDIENKIGLIL